MNYEEFRTKLQEELKDYLGENYKETNVEIRETMKVNKVGENVMLTGIPGHENASPSISVMDLYKSYENTGDFNGVMEKLAADMDKAVKSIDTSPIKNALDFSKVEENIFFTLCNAEENRDLLETVPHREFEDLAIIYRWNVGGDKDGLYTNIINNDFAEKIGLSEEQLFELADKNTKTLFPPTIRDMQDVICEMMFGDSMEPEMEDEFRSMMAETPPDKAMYVISNERNLFGAASMLYQDQLQELSEKLDSNLYILPSSVHECIAISDKFGDPEDLAQMVYEINMDQVEVGERLSNQVYHYDKDLRTLRLATDTVNKSIADDVSKSGPDLDVGKVR